MNRSKITHPEFGEIVVTRNPRARRIIMRARRDALYITLPAFATERDLQNALAAHGDTLKKQLQKRRQRTIDFDFVIDTEHFKIGLQPQKGAKPQIKKEGGCYTLFCPLDMNFEDNARQEWLRKIIVNTMNHRAKELLPQRLEELATEYGFKYNAVAIRNSHTRWGSCSSRGNISLSVYLILLPDELIDYVLLHELCHTREMNHSPRFWELLNSVTSSQALALRKKLGKFKTDF